MKRYIWMFACCLFFGMSGVDALTYVKGKDNVCTETEDYIKWKKLSASEKENYFMPVRCEEFLRQSKNASTLVGSPFNVDYKTAKKFSLLEQNKLTKVKDQGDTQLCWAFTTNAILESAYMIEYNESVELSVKHLDYNTIRTLDNGNVNFFGYSNRSKNQGGHFLMSGTYLASGRGPVLESKVPWSSTTTTNMFEKNADYYVSDVDFLFAKSCDSNAILNIKEKLVNYGPVGATIYDEINSLYLSSDKSSYYYYGSKTVNHAITIVGWDDDYSANNFVKKPAGNGAWLVKDSYLDSFGGSNGLPKGYVYVSYYDNNLCSFNMSAYNITNKTSDNLYTFAKLGYNQMLTVQVPTVYYKNIYLRQNENEQLNKINLYINTDDQYELYYSEKDDFNSATKIASGTGTKDGYTTINLTNPVNINSNKFYIYLKYTSKNLVNTSYYYPAARVDASKTDENLIYYRVDYLDIGVSFYSGDASSWVDSTSNSSTVFYFPMYVFTDNYTPTVSESIKISSTEKSSDNINSTDGGYFRFNLKLDSVSIDDVKVNIYSKDGSDVTSLFKVSKYDTGYKVDLTSKTTAGTYTIKFTYKELAASQSFTVLEKARETIYVKSISITGSDEVSVGGTLNLKAEVLPDNADTKTVSWTSSNPSFATVDKNGIVKGYTEGSVTITATSTDGSNIKAYKLIKIIDINKEEGNGTTVIDKPNDDKDGSDNKNTGKDKKESNPDTGFSDTTTILLVCSLVSIIIVLYIKKYNLFKKI